MKKFNKAMEILKLVEHSNRNDKLLHKNEGENGLTYFGIYQSAHPKLKIWRIIESYLKIEPDIKKCSVILSNVSDLTGEVYRFYKQEFWNKMGLDKVNSGHICNEMFIFGVNVNWDKCNKEVQKMIGVKDDGIIGDKTIAKINEVDEEWFDKEFDKVEMEYYERIVEQKPHLAKNLKGWFNRSLVV